MMTSYFNLLKYAATGIASPDMTYYDKLRASTLMGGVVQTLTGQPPLTFKADGTPLISWSMKGNGQQTGTPTPDNPVMPDFCGTLDGTDWKIPITCAGQTVPVYLGEVPTVRKIRKIVFDGTENWHKSDTYVGSFYAGVIQDYLSRTYTAICTHIVHVSTVQEYGKGKMVFSGSGTTTNCNLWFNQFDKNTTVADFKSYLASEYAAGHPVTVWYVLKTEQTTAIVNEPLCKIGDYCDELNSTDAGVQIPTVNGENTLTVDTELQPSSMTITGRIQENV